MDTGKAYYDTEGNECSIWQMVMREPHWAANRIQEGEKALEEITRLRAELEAAKGEAEALRVDAERLLSVLVNIYSTLESANVDGIITDTIWMPVHVSKSETLFDYIDAAIDAARGGK